MGSYDDNPANRRRRRWEDGHGNHVDDEVYDWAADNGDGPDAPLYDPPSPARGSHGRTSRDRPPYDEPRHGSARHHRMSDDESSASGSQPPHEPRATREPLPPFEPLPPYERDQPSGYWPRVRPAGRAQVPDRPVARPEAAAGRRHGLAAAIGGHGGGGTGGGGNGGGGTGGGGNGGGGTGGGGNGGGGTGSGGFPRWFTINHAWMARRRTLLAAFAVLIILTGSGVVGATYFVDGVKTSSELTFPETTTVHFVDGTVLARLGEVTRYELKFDEMNDPVVKSIVASEDQTFWTNEGVDFGGVMRAAWNNFTGGDTQGASTITQQYARLAFDLEGVTYQRKAREAVLAWKISDDLDKKQILESYLNSVPFGRQTYGIEAAAQAFFGKTAKKTAKPEQQITWAEAMVLVAMVKQPNPNPDDPKGQPGYDPTVSPEAEANARRRFDYVRSQLVETKVLSQTDADKLAFPKDQVKPYNPNVGNGLETPAGIVVNHVLSELTHTPSSPFNGAKDWKAIREGGYQIFTTIEHGAQVAAEAAANEKAAGSPMSGQPANLQAALVAVEPGTGRVLAYYGGNDGKGADYGGFYYDEKNVATGVGRFPPGSSFKVYTLAAALKAGISLKSYWDWNPHDMTGRTGSAKIRNASTCGDLKEGDPTPCSLLQSTISSLNVPYYAVTLSVSPAKVLDMARKAGIDYMWTDDRQRQDLRAVSDMGAEVPSKFDTVLGIGQYSITVMDHANGLATFAAGGVRANVHFVRAVKKGETVVYGETLPANNQQRVFSQQNSNDLTYALSQVGSAKVNIGWDTAGKTGTWEFSQQSNENAHAWMVGYSKKIAAAVWVGNKAEEKALRDKSKKIIYGSGVPAEVWRKFMTAATKALNQKKENTRFNPPNYGGDVMPDGAVPSPGSDRGNDPGGGWFNWPTRGPRQNR